MAWNRNVSFSENTAAIVPKTTAFGGNTNIEMEDYDSSNEEDY
ncbi:MAG: hypothetical protein ABJG37_20755 [Ekhidna sp.]